MKTATRRKFSVTEAACGAGRVDRAAGIIRGVKILGRTSLNNREYTTQAMAEAAKHYEGMRVNLDHPAPQDIKKSRSVRDWIGQLESIQVRDNGVFGDLCLIKSHPHAAGVMEAAERWPNKFGLSHNADCSGFTEGRKQIVESVENVRSVDLVQRPATNSSLFESLEEPMRTRSFKQVFESIRTAKPTSRKGRIRQILEMDGMADALQDNSGPPVGNQGQSERWNEFRATITSYLDNSDLDAEATVTKIQQVIDEFKRAMGYVTDTSSNSTMTATEGYYGDRSALNYGGPAGMAAMIAGRTPPGAGRSMSVTEDFAGRSALSYSGGAKGLAKAIGSKGRHR